MPYIHPDQRKELDPAIDALLSQLKLTGAKSDVGGCFNYVITRIALGLVVKPSYKVWSGLVGVLETCKLELYRRFVGPYEDLKRTEHGDVIS